MTEGSVLIRAIIFNMCLAFVLDKAFPQLLLPGGGGLQSGAPAFLSSRNGGLGPEGLSVCSQPLASLRFIVHWTGQVYQATEGPN